MGTEVSFLGVQLSALLECFFPFTFTFSLLLRSWYHVLPAHLCTSGFGHSTRQIVDKLDVWNLQLH